MTTIAEHPTTPAEEWLPVVGWEDSYEVSDHGRVRSLPRQRAVGGGVRTVRGRVLKPQRQSGDHVHVTLCRPGEQVHRKVHQLVCEAFHGPRPGDALTRHRDGDPANNAATNVTWGTGSENTLDSVEHGTHNNARKTRCKRDHPLTGGNLGVNATTGGRFCRRCDQLGRARRVAS